METNDEKKVRVTFEQPDKQCGICWGGGKIEIDDLGNEENCISCNGTGVIEPEAAGQEQAISEFEHKMISHLTDNLKPVAHSDVFTWQEIVNAVFKQQKP